MLQRSIIFSFTRRTVFTFLALTLCLLPALSARPSARHPPGATSPAPCPRTLRAETAPHTPGAEPFEPISLRRISRQADALRDSAWLQIKAGNNAAGAELNHRAHCLIEALNLLEAIDYEGRIARGESFLTTHAVALLTAADYLAQAHRRPEAATLYELALNPLVGTPSVYAPQMPALLRSCADNYLKMGNTERALYYTERTVESQTTLNPDNTAQLIDDYTQLAVLRINLRLWSEAREPLALAMIALKKQGETESALEKYGTLFMLAARCCYELEDYPTALSLYRSCNELYTDLRPNRLMAAHTHHFMALVAVQQQQTGEALMQMALALKALGDDTDHMTPEEQNLWCRLLVEYASNDPDTAFEEEIDLYENVMNVYENNDMPDAEGYAQALMALALAQCREGQTTEGMAHWQQLRALPVCQTWRGSQLYLDLLINNCLLWAQNGSPDQSIEALQEVAAYISGEVCRTFPTLTEDERATYLQKVSGWYSRVLPTLALPTQRPAAARMCYDAALQSRGILLQTTVNLDRMAEQAANPAIAELNKQRKRSLERAQRWTSRGLTQRADEQNLIAARLEKRMLRELAAYGDPMNYLRINADSVRQALREGEMAVEFVRCTNLDDTDTTYVALTLMRHYRQPHALRLFTQSQLNALRQQLPFTDLGETLYRALWLPVVSDAGKKPLKHIYFAADGTLHQLPVEYCTTPEGDLMAERYRCTRLSSTRRLVHRPNARPLTRKAALFGHIDYDAPLTEPQVHDTENRLAQAENAMRGEISAAPHAKNTQQEAEKMQTGVENRSAKTNNQPANAENRSSIAENRPAGAENFSAKADNRQAKAENQTLEAAAQRSLYAAGNTLEQAPRARHTPRTAADWRDIGHFRPLPGTRAEADTLADFLMRRHIHTLPFTDRAATRKALQQLSAQNINLLHIGTHGLYVRPERKHRYPKLRNLFGTDLTGEAEALTRTALVMAGANRLSADSTARPEAFATAYDISTLDFSSLSLVVLSACETGLGDVDGEGVFGLQRGFKKAGTDAILMSLLRVDDGATTCFTTTFYRALLLQQLDPHTSLLQALNAVRNHPSGQWSDPLYWAAFVLLDAL